MMLIRPKLAILASWLTIGITGPAAAVPSFSGAEGWGAITPGGRGGQVIHVTNLNDSGPGSFREAVTASGPRTVVFDVAGQIDLQSEINVLNPYLTIAGQTAPGDGITIAGETLSMDTHDVIVRHMRFRRGYDINNTAPRRDDSLGSDRLNGNYLEDTRTGHIIIDHVSASWGLDENLSIYRNKLDASLFPGPPASSTVFGSRNITLQWSISSEALNPFRHAFGSTLGGPGSNQHHNLWASNTGRNPSIAYSDFMDFRNNVIFNWMHRSVSGAGPEAHVNIINNYYKPGPATGLENAVPPEPTVPWYKYTIVNPDVRSGVAGPGAAGWWYIDGNYVDGYPTITADNWEGEVMEIVNGQPMAFHGVQWDFDEIQGTMLPEYARVLAPHTHVERADDPDDPFDDDGSGMLPGSGNPLPIPDLPIIATQSALDAYLSVLAGVGASLVRDAVDLRIIDSVATGIATAGPRGDGIINHPDDVGGYPVILFVERGPDWDTDGDGMPDQWEVPRGIDPSDPEDRNGDFDSDGFTNLEEYLNELGAFKAVEDVVWDNTLGNGRYAQIENWQIAFQPSRFDTAVINSGTVVVDAIGQDAGTLKLASVAGSSAALDITAGRLEVAEELVIGAHPDATAALALSGGALWTPLLSKGDGGSFDFTGGVLSADEVAFDLVNDGGTIAPAGSQHPLLPADGSSIGQTEVAGSLAINSGVLEIEILGREFGQYDRLETHGLITLGGTLRVRLLESNSGPFEPQLGDAFVFLAAYGGYEEEFDDFDLPELAPGLAWTISPGDVVLYLAVVAAPLAGDYNDDGIVDAADYTVWRDNLGRELSLSNETASLGVVDDEDYDAWKANFGATGSTSGQASLAAVPEPSSIWMVLGGLVLPWLRRHHAARQLSAGD